MTSREEISSPPDDARPEDTSVSSPPQQQWSPPTLTERHSDESSPNEPTTTPPRSFSFLRLLLTLTVTFMLSWTVLSFLSAGAIRQQTEESYFTICPEEGNALSEILSNTKLLSEELTNLYFLGAEKASVELYARRASGCELDYLVFPTLVGGAEAKTLLTEAGWDISSVGQGLFTAEKTVGNTTYTINYPSVENNEEPIPVTLYLTYDSALSPL